MGFALASLVVLLCFFGVAVFAPMPYAAIALAVTPVPFIGVMTALVLRIRLSVRALRNARNASRAEGASGDTRQ
ncbi:hypothetical protein DOE76_07450 [Leifsonia sp. ku-ls]|nr:hypothetical protein DOE76_07450 [Leifsonia sp. ku-ls]